MSAQRGTRVIVTGRVKQRTYDGVRAEVLARRLAAARDELAAADGEKPVKAERAAGGNGGEPVQVCTKCANGTTATGRTDVPATWRPSRTNPPL